VQDRPGFIWGILLLLVPGLFIAEHRLRSRSTALTFALGAALSTFAVVVVGRLAGALGSRAALHAALQRDGGSSAAGWALIAGCATSLPARRARRAIMVGLFALLGMLAVVSRGEADLEHIIGAICGAGIVAMTARLAGDR
jgi:hypothetical protein